MQAANPEFRAVVAAHFAAQPFMTTLGAQLVRIEPGEVEARLVHAPHLTQQNGFLHAGVMAAAADSACGAAALSLQPAGADVLAVEFKINYLAPARAALIVVLAQVLKAGRTLCVVQAQVFGEQDGVRELICLMQNTIFVKR